MRSEAYSYRFELFKYAEEIKMSYRILTEKDLKLAIEKFPKEELEKGIKEKLDMKDLVLNYRLVPPNKGIGTELYRLVIDSNPLHAYEIKGLKGLKEDPVKLNITSYRGIYFSIDTRMNVIKCEAVLQINVQLSRGKTDLITIGEVVGIFNNNTWKLSFRF